MSEVKIEINKKVDILWYDKVYKSIVQDISENYIAIAAPIMGGTYLPFHKGDTFSALYYVDDKELYEFQGLVVGRRFEEKVQLVILEYPRKMKQVQRREFVRVEISHPIKYVKSVLEDDFRLAGHILDDNKGSRGTLLDISGGGLRIKTAEKMEHGNLVTVDIDLLERSIRVTGKLVRVSKDENDNYVCGISFINMNERMRDKIIQLIFEIMRKQLKTV